MAAMARCGAYFPHEQQDQLYFWELYIPRRSRGKKIQHFFRNSLRHKSNDIRFKTNLLEGVQNTGEVLLTSTRILVSLELPSYNGMVTWSIKSCLIEFYSPNQMMTDLRACVAKRIYRNTNSESEWIAEAGCLHGQPLKYWNDKVNRIRVCFFVEKETRTSIPPYISVYNKNLSGLDNKGWEGTSQFFLSDTFSDLEITCACGQTKFPAHKVILSSRSLVFNHMLNFPAQWTGVKGKSMKITQMKSNVLKELLRFIYCGKVENINDVSEELILAADKYNIPTLKALCEESLITLINAENATRFLYLGESVNANSLAKYAFNCIKMKKSEIFEDPEKLLYFTREHPNASILISVK